MSNIAKLFLGFGFALGLFTQQIAHSQGAITYLSNLSSPSVASFSNARSGFITGNNPGGYILNAVRLAMNDATGIPNSPNSFSVTIYEITNSTGGSGLPGENYVGTLNGSAPLKAGVFNYVPASQLILLPDSDYDLLVAGGDSGSSFEWSGTFGSQYFISLGGWSYGDTLAGPQYAVIATPVPEPNFCYLFAIGGLGILFYRRFYILKSQ